MNINNYLFIGCAYSDNQKACFLKNSIRGYQYAAQNFQEALIDGFTTNCIDSFSVLSIPSLSTFPNGCKSPIIKDSDFYYRDKVIGKSYGFLNLPFLNHCNQIRIDKHIENWYNASHGGKNIIVYAMLKHQMQYAVRAKKRHPDIKLCLIIPDLPMYMACNKYYKLLGLQKRDMRSIDIMLQSFDSTVVLAKPMVDKLNIGHLPYAVVEGIYCDVGNSNETFNKFVNKTIMYAGGIVSRYGVFDLIEAFHRIDDPDIRLLLCGPCPELEKLHNYLSKDKRIDYRGLISTTEVRKLQRQVTLLVNPRHSTEEFTKYSFPSKTLEYMASRTPVLMSNLPSMPEEYKQHLYLFDNESIEGMKQSILSVLSKEDQSLIEKGNRAHDFIMSEKQSSVQVKKILTLLNK